MLDGFKNTFLTNFELSNRGYATILTIIFYFFAIKTFSQKPIYFESITTAKGLSQSDVNAIHQDKDGFMWFGTHDGLNRYDGHSFKVYKPNPDNTSTISSNLIYRIKDDQKGNLWIGSTGGGLIYFDRTLEKFTTYKYNKEDTNSLNSNYISSIYRDKKNRLWVGTDKGINMLDLKATNNKVVFKHFKIHQEPLILNNIGLLAANTVYEDSIGQIWLGGYEGIYKLSVSFNGDEYFRCVNKEIKLPNVAVRNITEKGGRLLLATNNGLFYRTKDTKKLRVEKILNGSFNNLIIDKNIIWAGTANGLWEISYNSSEDKIKKIKKYVYAPNQPNSISKDIITDLYKDKSGIIWAGTNGGGVNKFDPNRKEFIHVQKTQNEESLSYDKIRSFYEDSNQNLWIGTEGGGLNKMLKNYNSYTKFQDLKNVYAIEEVKIKDKTYLFIGGTGEPELLQLDISKPESKVTSILPYHEFRNSIFSLLQDSRSYLWIGTYNGGLHRWKLNSEGDFYQKDYFLNNIEDPQSLSSNIIRNIFEDSNGNIWIATSDGLSLLPKEEVSKEYPKFKIFKKNDNKKTSLSHNYILSIHEDLNKNIWIGTFGGGLNKIIKTPTNTYEIAKVYSEKNGLPNNVIKGILEDDNGNLWLSSNKGITNFNPEKVTFRNYDINDGLQDNEFQELAYFKRKNGDFLFGGVNGFNVFKPKNLKENTYLPKTVITQIYISNEEVIVGKIYDDKILLSKAVNKTKEINFNHSQNNISFEFASLHYAAPEKNKFKYKLEGFDANWQNTTSSKRFAAYTNLAPGNYKFKVKSSNNDGLWNNDYTSIALHIETPFWLTWWAYMIYGVLILFFLLSIISYFNLKSKQKAAYQVQKEIEEVNKLKLQFFTNISHEFKTPITLILNPIEELLESVSNNDAFIKSKLNVVKRNADSLLRLVHQLMEFRRIEVGETKLGATKSNIINFVREVVFSFKSIAKKKDVTVSFECELYKVDIWFDWDKLEKILNNLVHNAIKFTPEGGEVKIIISKPFKDKIHIENRDIKTEYLQIEIKDNGVGIKKDELPFVFQRFYQVNQVAKNENKGSGIGLAITKDLVDLHHGTIAVTSDKLKGTNFLIKLPLGKEHLLSEEIIEICIPEPIKEEELDLDENLEKINIEGNSKSTVLVVDDNRDIRQLIKDGLSKKYNILEAEHGREALNIALKMMPDIVITDVLMPEMDGVEFCCEIKKNIRTSHIPVIMLTALNLVEHKIKGLESGADAYLPKPFKMKLLSVRVDKLIESRDLMRKRFQTEKELTPEKVTLNSTDEGFLRKIMDFMEVNMAKETYWVDELAFDMNTSRSTFFRKLKKLTGQSPNDFMRLIRLKRAMQLLEQNELSISQISYMVGFNDPGYFGKCFRKIYGDSPSKFLKTKK
ncbi:hybrid sensor histidine kinase/response regulator transcription factor [Polaribacter sp. SA4-12]|uniref:hybrid sensor histidine kinase/response regulator transcription factor n=1 Tax=Polaribacter sp. SA4-12 TaxID=1312072 RepID=UPI000B3CFA87|nr:two-component regulator propeller domain-containing protein [Polaribacter sp. SA4-12]